MFRDPVSIANFGVGRNMIGSMRYWATATGILDDTEDGLAVSWFGEMLFGDEGIDLHLEEDFSLWLIHWHLASRPRLTSFYWLFNHYRGGSFLRKDIVLNLTRLADDCGWARVAESTVDRDVQCLVRSFIGGRGANSNGDSILAELGLILPIDKARSKLATGRKPTLPDAVFAWCLEEFWNGFSDTQSTMSFESLAYGEGSPGRVFLLDEHDLVDRLERLENVTGGDLNWSETVGLRQVIRRGRRSDERRWEELRETLKTHALRAAV